MKKYVSFLLTLGFLVVTNNVFAQGTAFTYQGQLQSGGSPANGNYDFTFALYNANTTSGTQVGGTLTDTNVGVTNGLFTVTLDFGSVFTGNATWLAIGVRTNGGAGFTALNPLQPLTPAPYAIFAEGANAAGLAGTISNSNIANGSITSNLLAVGAVGSSQIASGIGLWSQSGPNVYYNNGYAGIGTATPATPLNVVSANDYLNTFLSGSSSVGTWLTLGNTGGGAQWTFISTGSGNGEGASNLVIHPGTTLGGVSSFTGLQLQPNGMVGIDTRNLTSTLTVNGSGSFTGSVGIGTTTPSATLAVTETNGANYGNAVYANTLVPGANGIMGESDVPIPGGTGPGGGNIGVFGLTSSTNGAGVYGDAWAATGVTYGVVGTVSSPQGFAGYFLGNSYFSGNVGIGTTNPTTALEVSGTVAATTFSGSGSALTSLPANAALLNASQTFTGQNSFSGNVGIGTAGPSALLDIKSQATSAGGIRLEDPSDTGFWNITIDPNGDALVFSFTNRWPGIGYAYLVPGSAGLITTSDRRVKKDIAAMGPCLDRVMALKPSTFRYKTSDEGTPVNYGFIAQDIEEQFPDLVLERNGLKTLVGDGITAINTRAIQDLNQKLEDRSKELENENAELKKQNDLLAARFHDLETMVKALAEKK